MGTPYKEHVGDRNPVDVLRDSYAEYRAIVPKFDATQWAMPWQPGKWTAQQIMVHVMQWEMIMGVRLRLAAGAPDYTVQPANQDDLMGTEDRAIDGPTAFATFDAVRRVNLLFAEALSAEQRAKKVKHPERGVIDVEDILTTIAGHGVHHLKQFKTY
jgi:hypothetical protein